MRMASSASVLVRWLAIRPARSNRNSPASNRNRTAAANAPFAARSSASDSRSSGFATAVADCGPLPRAARTGATAHENERRKCAEGDGSCDADERSPASEEV